MCATRISLGLVINEGMLFGLKQEAHFLWTRDRSRLTGKSLSAVKCLSLMSSESCTRRPSVDLVSETGLFL